MMLTFGILAPTPNGVEVTYDYILSIRYLVSNKQSFLTHSFEKCEDYTYVIVGIGMRSRQLKVRYSKAQIGIKYVSHLDTVHRNLSRA